MGDILVWVRVFSKPSFSSIEVGYRDDLIEETFQSSNNIFELIEHYNYKLVLSKHEIQIQIEVISLYYTLFYFIVFYFTIIHKNHKLIKH